MLWSSWLWKFVPCSKWCFFLKQQYSDELYDNGFCNRFATFTLSKEGNFRSAQLKLLMEQRSPELFLHRLEKLVSEALLAVTHTHLYTTQRNSSSSELVCSTYYDCTIGCVQQFCWRNLIICTRFTAKGASSTPEGKP